MLYRWGQSSQQQPFPGAAWGCKYEQREEEAAEIHAGRAERSDIGGFLLETEFSAAPREFGQRLGTVISRQRRCYSPVFAGLGPRERASE